MISNDLYSYERNWKWNIHCKKSYKIHFNFERKNVSFLQNWNTYILEINVGSNSGKSDRKSTEYFKPWRYILGKFSIEKNWSVQFHNRTFCKKESTKGFSFNLNSLQDRVLEYAQHSWLTIAYIIIIMKISDVRHRHSKCQKISNDIIVCINKLK